MTLWLMRHAQPCVAPGVCYGVLDMVAQVEATRQAAFALAEVLPQGLAAWVSPLQRCELLAQYLRGLRPDLTFETDPRLGEMNFGEWEGVPWADVPRTALDAWTADFGEHRFGGMESVNMVLARVRAAWSDTLLATRSSGAPGALWITHAGVIRAVGLVAQGVYTLADAAQWPQDAPGYGHWTQVALNGPF